MKKRILLIVFIFLSFLSFAQQSNYAQNFYVPNPYQTPSINITDNQIINGWAVYGNTCAGCVSYYYKITRTTSEIRAENGNYYYYYYLWFFTNSYYSNGQHASTYLNNIVVYVDGKYVVDREYALATNQEQYFIWIRAANPYSRITFQITKISIY